MVAGALHRGICQAAQVGHRRFEVGPTEQVAYADAQIFAGAILPQPLQEFVRPQAVGHRGADRGAMLGRGFGVSVAGTEEYALPLRAARDQAVGEKRACAENEEQVRAGLRGLQRPAAAEPVFADTAQIGRGQRRVRRLGHTNSDVGPRRTETRRGQPLLQREQGTQGIRRQIHGSVPRRGVSRGWDDFCYARVFGPTGTLRFSCVAELRRQYPFDAAEPFGKLADILTHGEYLLPKPGELRFEARKPHLLRDRREPRIRLRYSSAWQSTSSGLDSPPRIVARRRPGR